MKIIPEKWVDSSINFKFKYKNCRFTIRFAGRPLIILEQLYKDAGGEDFKRVYELAKATPEALTPKEMKAFKYAYNTTKAVLNALNNSELSPLVIYVRDKDYEIEAMPKLDG